MIEVALTFDVEQWDDSSRAPSYDRLIGALDDVPTTWFVAEDQSQSTVGRYPRQMERVMAAGHEVAAHVHFAQSEPERMLQDIRAATQRLRDFGSECVSFRGGGHVFNDLVADELVSLGYRWDSSAVPGLVREYNTRSGKTVAAYAHVWDARPFWWRPGLLELPLAAFPLNRPYAFARKRFRLPFLLRSPKEFVARLGALARTRPGEDLPVVIMGHSFDFGTESEKGLREITWAIMTLRRVPVRFNTLDNMARRIVSGDIRCWIRPPPGALRSFFGRVAATGALSAARRLRGIRPR